MTKPRPIRPAPPHIEAFARQIDRVFTRAEQAEAFRDYLTGLDLPTEVPKHVQGMATALPDASYDSLHHLLTNVKIPFDTLNTIRVQLLLPWLHDGGVLVIGELYDAPPQGKGTKGTHGPARLIGLASCWVDDQFVAPLGLAMFDDLPSSPTALAAAKADLAVDLIEQADVQLVPFHMVVHGGADISTGRMLAMPLEVDHISYLLGLLHADLLTARSHERRLVDGLLTAAHEHPSGGWKPVLHANAGGFTRWFVRDLSALAPALGTPHLILATADPHAFPPDATFWLRTNMPPVPHRRRRGRVAAQPVEEQVDPHLAHFLHHDAVDRFVSEATGRYGWTDARVLDPASQRRHWLLICCLYTARLLATLAASEDDADDTAGTIDEGFVLHTRVVPSSGLATQEKLVERLDRSLGVPMKLAGRYAKRLTSVPAVHVVATRWNAEPEVVPDILVRGYRLRELVRDHGLTPLHALLLLADADHEQALAAHQARIETIQAMTPSARLRLYAGGDLTLVPLQTQHLADGTSCEVEVNPALVLRDPTTATLADLLDSARHGHHLHEVDRLNERFLRQLGRPASADGEDDGFEPVLYLADDRHATLPVTTGYYRWTLRWYRLHNQPFVDILLEARDIRDPWHQNPEPVARPVARHLLHAPATPRIVADWILHGARMLETAGVRML